jgi:hypothetical protein
MNALKGSTVMYQKSSVLFIPDIHYTVMQSKKHGYIQIHQKKCLSFITSSDTQAPYKWSKIYMYGAEAHLLW